MTNEVRYPDIHVQLTGRDGNAFGVIGAVSEALRRDGVSREEINLFADEAMSGDYDNLLRTAQQWVSVS